MIPHREVLAPGQRVGPYVLEAELGRGGMGAVYRARHAETGAVHALKVILRHRIEAGAESALARFQREAESLARVEGHPGILRIFGVGVAAGVPWCAMEYIDGTSLADRLDRGALPPREAARIVSAVARAIDHAHACAIVHRDLKPENVLIDRAGQPRVVDFGLAYDAQQEALTKTGQMLGTPHYMAPEQVERSSSGEDIGPATDVWGLGAVLYAALTSRPPWSEESGLAILGAIVRRDPIPPRDHDGGIPAALDAIVLKALRKRPADRYASAAALADDLDRWLAGEPILATVSSPLGRFVRRLRRRRVIPFVAIGALGLALLGAFLLVGGRTHDPGPLLDRLERALNRGDLLDDEWRDRLDELLARIGEGATIDQGIVDRASAVDLIDRVMRTDDVEASAALSAHLRRGGEVDRTLAERASKALRGADRLAALHRVLHGESPAIPASGQAALELARLIAADGSALTPPFDAAAFDALVRAPGLEVPARGRLLVRRAQARLAASTAGELPALDAAIDDLVRAIERHDVAPPRALVSRSMRARACALLGEGVRANATDRDRLAALLDLIVIRDRDIEDPMPADEVASLQNLATDLSGGLVIGDERIADREPFLLLLAWLEIEGVAPFHEHLLLRVAERLGVGWTRRRATEEIARPRPLRNPAILGALARVHAENSGGTDRAAEVIAWLDAIDDVHRDERWVEMIHGIAAREAEVDAVARIHLERAYAIDRELPDHARWPLIGEKLSRMVDREDVPRGVALLIEATRIQFALQGRLDAIVGAGGFTPPSLAAISGLQRQCANLIGHLLHQHPAPSCCTATELTPEELHALGREISATFGVTWPDEDEVEGLLASHRRRHPEAATGADEERD